MRFDVYYFGSSSFLLWVETQRFGRCIPRSPLGVRYLSGYRNDSTFLKFDCQSDKALFLEFEKSKAHKFKGTWSPDAFWEGGKEDWSYLTMYSEEP